MATNPLFPELPLRPEPQPGQPSEGSTTASGPPRGRPRILEADRRSARLVPTQLDALLPADHAARAVWAYVLRQDLSALYEAIRAREGMAGRPAIDPQILLALWLYATLEAVGSARELDRLCRSQIAFQWICGGVSVNYHTLADFRTQHVDLLERLLVAGVATLMSGGLVDLCSVAQDGMRVRASAGADTFRRRETLEQYLELAKDQVEKLRSELDDAPGASNRRSAAAQQRAAAEREERLTAALEELAKIEAREPVEAPQGPERDALSSPPPPEEPPAAPPADSDTNISAAKTEKKPSKPPRASPTDPEARRMKMADGGFRPAYNVQFATDVGSQIIVGVSLGNEGTDVGQLEPMIAKIKQDYDRVPQAVLVDGGYVHLDAIERLETDGITVIAPVPTPKNPKRDRYQPLPRDPPGVAAWRARMGTEEAKKLYIQRGATAECVNALARQRGLHQFPVRGQTKAYAIALWLALAHNLRRALTLHPHLALGAG